MKEELATEKAENATLKAKLELTLKKMQFIAVDAIFHVRAKLMGKFKRGKHASWDLDQEIQTWKDREAMLAKGDDEESKEKDELTLIVESPRQVKPEIATAEKSAAEKEVREVEEVGPKEFVNLVVS